MADPKIRSVRCAGGGERLTNEQVRQINAKAMKVGHLSLGDIADLCDDLIEARDTVTELRSELEDLYRVIVPDGSLDAEPPSERAAIVRCLAQDGAHALTRSGATLKQMEALRAENARTKELMAMQVQFGTEMQDRADRLEKALVEVANLSRSENASRDPFGTLDHIPSVAWTAIDGPLASSEARAAARSTGETPTR